MELVDFLLLAPVLLYSIVLHEVAHGWQARREGDPTAERAGRITLNPVPHVDPIGSVLLPMLLWFSNAGFLFGWAKPVPVDPRNFADPRWGDIRVSLAGIVVNLALAVLCMLGLAAVLALAPRGPVAATLGTVLQWGLLLNLVLAFFNLLPIPPLDGSHVVAHFLPARLARAYRGLGRYGMLVLLVLFIVPGAFDVLLWPVDVAMGAADWFIRLWI